LRDFAKAYDKIVFVAGLKSSNGKVLYDVCKDNNENTYFVSNKNEVNKDWFKEGDRIGICGATSTPQWQMDEIKEKLLNL
jgi:4-hydroxy-3-methylbut-2-enyl diphosphate reductase